MAKRRLGTRENPVRVNPDMTLQTWCECSRCGHGRTGRECEYCEGFDAGWEAAKTLPIKPTKLKKETR